MAPYRHDIEACLESRIGAAGLGTADLAAELAAAGAALDRLRGDHDSGRLPLLELPGRHDDLEMLQPAAALARQWPAMLVLGTGGSSLGGQAATALVAGRGSAALPVFADNIDPDTFADLLDFAVRDAAGILVVSKSGSTAETVAQCLAAWDRLRDPDRFMVLTEPGDNPLRTFATARGIRLLDHDPGIGGRFSVLSNVGMLPALVAGLDAAAFRAGAAEVLDSLWSIRDAPPVLGAAIAVGLARRRGVRASVMLPYSDRLRPFSQWYCQLWAESLGKQGHGTMPYAAVGAVDQHSQLQLWLDGPADKLVTLVTLRRAGTGPRIEDPGADPRLAYLDGRTIGDLMEVEQRATAEALIARGRAVRQIEIDALDERRLGALFMHFMIETILAGYMLDIDPFDQPAVEEGKVLARHYLSEL